jgi:hypothetical protein
MSSSTLALVRLALGGDASGQRETGVMYLQITIMIFESSLQLLDLHSPMCPRHFDTSEKVEGWRCR